MKKLVPAPSVESTQSSDSMTGTTQAPTLGNASRGSSVGLMNSAQKVAHSRYKIQSGADNTSKISPTNEADGDNLQLNLESNIANEKQQKTSKFDGTPPRKQTNVKSARGPAQACHGHGTQSKLGQKKEDSQPKAVRRPPMTPKNAVNQDPIGQALTQRLKRGNVQTVVISNVSCAIKKPTVFKLKQTGQPLKKEAQSGKK